MRSTRGLWAVLSLCGLVAAEVAAVVALHRLGTLPGLAVSWDDPAGWLAVTAAEDVLLVVCRLVALACAVWLLGGTLLYTLAKVLRIPSAIRAVEWAALPAVRRVADRAVAVALATSSVMGAGAGGAWADGPAPPPPAVASFAGASAGAGAALGGYRPVPAGVPDLGGLLVEPQPRGMPTPVSPAPVPPPADQHVVVAGDDLWSIAKDRLAASLGVAPERIGPEQVAGYWRVLVRANVATLHSGDPDLLLPGEVLVLPPADTAGPG